MTTNKLYAKTGPKSTFCFHTEAEAEAFILALEYMNARDEYAYTPPQFIGRDCWQVVIKVKP